MRTGSLPRFAMGGRYATVDGFIRKARMRALPVVGIDPLTWHFLTEI